MQLVTARNEKLHSFNNLPGISRLISLKFHYYFFDIDHRYCLKIKNKYSRVLNNMLQKEKTSKIHTAVPRQQYCVLTGETKKSKCNKLQ